MSKKKTGLGKDPCRSTQKKKTGSRKRTGKSPTVFVPPGPTKKSGQVRTTRTGPKKGCPSQKKIPCILHQMGTLYEMTFPSSPRNVSPQTRRVQKHAARHRATIQLPVILYKMLFHSRCYLRNLRPTWYSLCL